MPVDTGRSGRFIAAHFVAFVTQRYANSHAARRQASRDTRVLQLGRKPPYRITSVEQNAGQESPGEMGYRQGSGSDHLVALSPESIVTMSKMNLQGCGMSICGAPYPNLWAVSQKRNVFRARTHPCVLKIYSNSAFGPYVRYWHLLKDIMLCISCLRSIPRNSSHLLNPEYSLREGVFGIV